MDDDGPASATSKNDGEFHSGRCARNSADG
jgi:hypothetical protein